jgi:glycosidase
MAFLDNHDVNRFIEDYYPDTEKADSMQKSLKQSLAILLTLPRIPQIYYGTEVLMGGTTEKSDSNVRKPFPKRCLTAEGRTPDENDMHRYVRRLLQWRKANSRLIAYGTMKQFIPYKGIYVYERRLDGASCLVIANGNNRVATFHPERYAEVIDPATSGTDIISGRTVSLTKPLRLSPRKTMIISLSTAPATAQD